MQVFSSEMSPHTVRHTYRRCGGLEAFVNRNSYSLMMDVAGFSETSVLICRSMASHSTSSYFRNMFLFIFPPLNVDCSDRLLCIYVGGIQK